ncbi:MAG: hypothetical protein MZW92_25305 [Comamonadaceae bacterium]|nr:hypothetical protein [Comamonadaceae bacterium]
MRQRSPRRWPDAVLAAGADCAQARELGGTDAAGPARCAHAQIVAQRGARRRGAACSAAKRIGLSNEELEPCASVPVTIPANPEYALAQPRRRRCRWLPTNCRLAAAALPEPPQAMRVRTRRGRERGRGASTATSNRRLIASRLPRSRPIPRRLMPRLRRLFARARLEKEEINILRGMLRVCRATPSESRLSTTGRIDS